MIHGHRVSVDIAKGRTLVVGLALVVAAALLCVPATVQAAGDPATFVSEQFAILRSGTATEQQKARDELISKVRGDFAMMRDAYAQAVNAEALRLLKDTTQIRPRLCAAIVVARVSESTGSPRLQESAIALLNDPSEVLQIWGMRAARGLLPTLIRTNSHAAVLERMLAVVKQNPSRPLMEEAFAALMPTVELPADRAIVAAVVDPLLTLIDMRVEAYRNTAPDDPANDDKPFHFLTRQGIWNQILTPTQQKRVLAAVAQILPKAANYSDEAPAIQKEQFRTTFRNISGGVWVAADQMKWQGLATAAKQAFDRAENPTVKLTELWPPVIQEIRKLPGYADIAAPALGTPQMRADSPLVGVTEPFRVEP